MESVKATVDAKIKGKKVMVFSKSTCPFCRKAKIVLKKYVDKELPRDEYEVWEIDSDPNCSKIQTYLSKLTGAATVPRVFINGKCIGGGTETEALDRRGELRRMLTAA